MKYPVLISTVVTTVFILLTSCANRESRLDKKQEEIIIKIDNKSKTLLNVNIQAIIPLETSPSCLIGYVSKLSFFNNRYYILDNFRSKAFFVFDEKGKLMFKTTKGKGPGEVMEPYTFDVNKKDSLVLLWDQALDSFIKLDLNGNYIKSEKHVGIFIKDFYRINRNNFLIYNSAINPDSKKIKQYLTYTLYSTDFTKEKHMDIFLSANKGSQDLYSAVSINGNEVLFVAPWNYNVYQLEGDKGTIRYTLNFGNYAFTSKELETFSTTELYEQMAAGKKVGCILSFFKTDDFLAFTNQFNQNFITFFQSIKTKNVYSFNDCIEAGLIPECEIRGTKEDGIFYGLVEPYQLLQFQQLNGQYKQLKINKDDNPFIIVFSVSER